MLIRIQRQKRGFARLSGSYNYLNIIMLRQPRLFAFLNESTCSCIALLLTQPLPIIYIYKILGVKPTRHIFRYARNQFTKQYHPTTGVDFYLKRTTLPGNQTGYLFVLVMSNILISVVFNHEHCMRSLNSEVTLTHISFCLSMVACNVFEPV